MIQVNFGHSYYISCKNIPSTPFVFVYLVDKDSSQIWFSTVSIEHRLCKRRRREIHGASMLHVLPSRTYGPRPAVNRSNTHALRQGRVPVRQCACGASRRGRCDYITE